VKHTALDAVGARFATRVITDLTAPVSAELGERARAALTEAGVELAESSAL
jgi:nicotinamidase/pyrazinamidase